MKLNNTKRLVILAMFCAIMAVMAVTNIGIIPLGFMNATTLHIPVILCAVLLGPKEGIFAGFLFGVISMLTATFRPSVTSFLFSPFYQSEFGNPLYSIFICFIPRMLIGVVAGYSYQWFQKTKMNDPLSLGITGFLGSITNTVFVMGGVYLLFGEAYASINEIAVGALGGVIGTVVLTNGVPEAVIASILTIAIGKPIQNYLRKR